MNMFGPPGELNHDSGEQSECVTVRVKDLLMASVDRCVHCVHRLVSGLGA
jgi:hypothetical protein